MKTRIPDEQLSLFEMAPAPLVGIPPEDSSDSFFLAAFPDVYTAQQIEEIGKTIRKKRNLRTKLRPVNHLHVSLHSLNRLANAHRTVGAVCEAVAAATPQFEIKFDRIMSFQSGGFGKRPLVLAGDDHGNKGVKLLHGALRAEFAKYGPTTGLVSSFRPHVTLLYEQLELPLEPIEPVCWTVKEIVLVRSEVLKTRYHFLARWPLGG